MGKDELRFAPRRLRAMKEYQVWRMGKTRAWFEQAHCVLQPRHAADERQLSQYHTRKFIWYRENPVAGGRDSLPLQMGRSCDDLDVGKSRRLYGHTSTCHARSGAFENSQQTIAFNLHNSHYNLKIFK